MSVRSRYTLTGPCAKCPFRNDQAPYLSAARMAEIGGALLDGKDFWCHQTVDHDDDEDDCADREPDFYQPGARTRACGGAMATLHNEDRSTQMERITERLGLPVVDTDRDAPVYGSVQEWFDAKVAAGPPR